MKCGSHNIVFPVIFEAAYHRKGTIRIVDNEECDSCKLPKKCLAIDSSAGEYGEGLICKPCIDKLFSDA